MDSEKKRFPIVTILILGLVAAASDVGTYFAIPWVLETVSTIGIVVVISVMGTGLYAIRGRWPQLYGLIEIGMGLLLTYDAASQVKNPSAAYLKVVAGLYVIVRGWDNLARFVKTTKYKDRWQRWFGPFSV